MRDASMRLCVRAIRMATFTHACLMRVCMRVCIYRAFTHATHACLIRVYTHIRACIRVAHYMHASCLCVCVIYVCMYGGREIEMEEGGIEREKRALGREGEKEREREECESGYQKR